MPLTALSLRFECDQESASVTSLTPLNYSVDPVIFRGNPTRIEASLFDGIPATGTFVTDISNVTEARIVLRKNHPLGTVLVNKIGTIDGTTAYATWANGTKQHFLFSLTNNETNQATPSDGTLDVYGVIVLTTDTGPITAGFFNGSIRFNGITAVTIPAVGAPGTNYIQQDGIFKVWNADQGLYQSIFPVGLAGVESVAVGS